MHWQDIKAEWDEYNLQHEPDVPAPSNKIYGGITFGYNTGYPLSDGLAINSITATAVAPAWFSLPEGGKLVQVANNGHARVLRTVPGAEGNSDWLVFDKSTVSGC